MCYGGCQCRRCMGPDEGEEGAAITRNEELAQRAKETTEQLLAEGVCLSDGECRITDRVILQALQQVERGVLEQVSNEAQRKMGMLLHPDHHIEFLSGWGNAHYDLSQWAKRKQKELG